MAVEVFPDTPSLCMSPRISFSHDDILPVEHYIQSSPSSPIDFNFSVFRAHESSSADELFFDGKILPIQIKKKLPPPRTAAPPPPPRLPPPLPPQKSTEEKQNYKSWFKRSTSLNCGSGYARTLCPLPLLSRSNSTGSTSSSGKRSSLSNNQKQSFAKYSLPNSSLKQCSSIGHQKPPLKKNSHGYYGSGVKISPVLNVPPATLFGFGFIFSGGKEKSRKK